MKGSWPETDRGKIVKLRSLDESAWRWFEDKYRERIIRFVQGLGCGRAYAEDITQAVLMKMRQADYRGEGLFRNFLKKTVRNACYDHWRGEKRCPAVGTGNTSMIDFLERQPAPEEEDNFDREYEKQLFLTVQKDVRHEFSEERDWEVFERKRRGEETKSIADSLGITPNHARQILFKITQRMRERADEMKEELETTMSQGR